MAILSDTKIRRAMRRGKIIIEPFFDECLGSNSYDVHLNDVLGVYLRKVIDSKSDNKVRYFNIPKSGFELDPEEFYLASTLEYTETYSFVPFLEGKSSTGRLGISIHETAGKGDVGFKGHWTLEMRAGKRVVIYPGMPIGQLMYHEVRGTVKNPYDQKANAKYSEQEALPVGSRMYRNFGKDPLWK